METFIAAVKVRVDQIVTQKKLNAEPLRSGEDSWHNHLRDASFKNGFDSFGFSALPAGYYGNYFKEFLDGFAKFWSSTERDINVAFGLSVFVNYARVDDYEDKANGFSVRCLRD